MLDIQGCMFDLEGPKSDDFSQLVKAVGVQFDLSNCADGVLTFGSTEKRFQETVKLIDGVLDSGFLDKKSAWSYGAIWLFVVPLLSGGSERLLYETSQGMRTPHLSD
jgi:hypothetical protein